MAQIQ